MGAANARKESAPGLGGGLSANAITPTDSLSGISIQNALEIFKNNFPDGLSQDVLNHFGLERPTDGTFADSVMFSLTFFMGADGQEFGHSMPETKRYKRAIWKRAQKRAAIPRCRHMPQTRWLRLVRAGQARTRGVLSLWWRHRLPAIWLSPARRGRQQTRLVCFARAVPL